MKKLLFSSSLALASLLLLGGCIAAIGNRDNQRGGGTVGQQLLDLQKAKEAGAITEGEFQSQKARLLGNR
jgi:hypothetical protein